MKKGSFYYLLCFALTACTTADLYDSDRATNGSDQVEELDLTFQFQMKEKKAISITAYNNKGVPTEGVPFEIFSESPYDAEGGIKDEVKPFYIGYTEKDGVLKATIVIPSDVTSVFIRPVFDGFGGMQEISVDEISAPLIFQGPTISQEAQNASVRSTRMTQEEYDEAIKFKRTGSKILVNGSENAYNVYSFYEEYELSNKGIPQSTSKLVSFDTYETGFVNAVATSMFPEKKYVQQDEWLTSENCTDLVVPTNLDGILGVQIWVSYFGDGDFSGYFTYIQNTLAYYTYTDKDVLNADFARNVRKTVVFPNTRPKDIAQGTKVQILYYDESTQSYSKIFPAGTHIGFVMIRRGYNAKYEADSKGVANDYGWGNNLNYSERYRFTSPELNLLNQKTAIAQGLIRANEEYQKDVVGMENRIPGDNAYDKDFNDILVVVDSDPFILPKNKIPDPTPKEETAYTYGTLAFEDQWPEMGDYDFNDFVVDYSYGITKKQNYKWGDNGWVYDAGNDISSVMLEFTPRAVGALYASGFGIQLPFKTDNIDLEKSTIPSTVKLDSEEEYATLIVYSNTHAQFPSTNKYINTKKGDNTITAESTGINLVLKTAVTEDKDKNIVDEFNPFIYVQQRSCEIHLVDKAPTGKADQSLFGIKHDRSDITKNIYYRMDNTYPWALDIPRLSASAQGWSYPKEMSIVTTAYPQYTKWIKDKKQYGTRME